MLDGPFRGSAAVAAGMLTRDQLFGSRFRRVFPGVYLPSDLELDLAVRSRAAYVFVGERGGVLAGYSAALMLGADCAPPNAPAEVAVPLKLTGQPGLWVHRNRIDAADLVEARCCRLTGPLRTAWDLARRLSLVEAVVAVDALAHRGAFCPADLLEYRAKHPGARGCRRMNEVVRLADPRAESPQETRLRVGLSLEGLPAPEVQYKIRDEYGFVLARVDLAYLEAKLALEYDGRNHLERWRWEQDRQRDILLARHGWSTHRLGHNELRAIHQTASVVRGLLDQRASSGSAVGF